jgi:hypothetical protein
LNANLLLYSFSCREMSGAYDHFSALLAAPADQPPAARAPQFRVPHAFATAQSEPVSEMPVNAGFDDGSDDAQHVSRGRGIGDCGSATEWIRNGREFVLSSYREMPKCSGILSEEWPVPYRAIRK